LARAGAVSLALVVVATAAACGTTPSAPQTVRVERGTVAVKVAASGAITPVHSQNLGFLKAAKLVELNVNVGDVGPKVILTMWSPGSTAVARGPGRACLPSPGRAARVGRPVPAAATRSSGSAIGISPA